MSAETIVIQVVDRGQILYSGVLEGPFELGRQSQPKEPVYSRSKVPNSDRQRLVVAGLDADTVSRRHVLIEPLLANRARVTNVSNRASVVLPDGVELQPDRSVELALPSRFHLGTRTIVLEPQALTPDDDRFEALGDASVPPGSHSTGTIELAPLQSYNLSGDVIHTLMSRLQRTMDVLQSATSSSDFFQKAAKALVDIVGLETGRVLLLEEGDWKTVALKSAARVIVKPEWQPSRSVLRMLLKEKKTFLPRSDQGELDFVSLMGMEAVVAAPILNPQGQVIGALYGDRRRASGGMALPQITRLEAMLVELLAIGVAAGLARIDLERAAIAARVQFEQFFTPELARELAANPDLLKGRESVISVLFCDIRGFSRICERLGPAVTVRWIGDVMEVLSECVLANRGVLVDYIGDELIAMWGAPEAQPDHPVQACRAALEMIGRLDGLNAKWAETIGEPIAVGIGINTGTAQVGNTGSRFKFKYGPLGNTVNLASRVQGATKYLKTKLLVTDATFSALNEAIPARRLGQFEVVNIAKPVELYELATDASEWESRRVEYETALDLFEKREFRIAARVLGNLISEHSDDGPSLFLMSQTVNRLVDERSDFSPVFRFPGK